MRLVLRMTLIAVTLVTSFLVSGQTHAAVPVACGTASDGDSSSCVTTLDSSGSNGGGSKIATSNSSDKMCLFNGEDIECSKDGNAWSPSYGCYLRGPVQPGDFGNVPGFFAALDPVESSPDSSAVDVTWQYYICITPSLGGYPVRIPDGAPPIMVDPEVVARIAVEQLNLQAIDIGIVPEAGPASVGLVGLPVWLWVNQPGAATYGPSSTSATVDATTVIATAQVTELVWNMGDGASVTCTTPGTPYADAYGNSMSPDCGHRYTRTSANQPGQVYQVTATSQWEVSWTGGGETGVIPVTLSSSTPVRVGEAQVLVQ